MAIDDQTRRTGSYIAMGIGSIILLYLTTQNLRFVNAGIFLALAGYLVEWIGLYKLPAAAVPLPHTVPGRTA